MYEKPPRILCNTPLSVRIIVESKRFEIVKKFHLSKTLLKLSGRGGSIPLDPPLFFYASVSCLCIPYVDEIGGFS